MSIYVYTDVFFFPVASVGFAEMTHVMQAGTVHRVCVVAEGVLEKQISVSLSVNELIPGNEWVMLNI